MCAVGLVLLHPRRNECFVLHGRSSPDKQAEHTSKGGAKRGSPIGSEKSSPRKRTKNGASPRKMAAKDLSVEVSSEKNRASNDSFSSDSSFGWLNSPFNRDATAKGYTAGRPGATVANFWQESPLKLGSVGPVAPIEGHFSPVTPLPPSHIALTRQDCAADSTRSAGSVASDGRTHYVLFHDATINSVQSLRWFVAGSCRI